MNIDNGLYESLFREMLNGFAHCRAVYDKGGTMIDWIYIRVNPAFMRQTGLPDPTGKSASVAIPGIRDADPELFRRFEMVAKGGKHQRWEEYVTSIGAWFDISVYSMDLHTLTVVFENISHRRKAHEALEIANEQIMTAFVLSLQTRDPTTKDHALRTTELSIRFAKYLGLDDETIIIVRRGALLHDIGKIGVADSILRKAGKLTAIERKAMQRHPSFARKILLPIEYLKSCVDIPYCHHEAWDGEGYPQGLMGDKIPYLARLFSVVDVYDAMTSARPYRKAFSREFVLKYIREQGGRLFDPEIAVKFLDMMGEDNG
jgi:HD-GYP domain-containing protein (c-di-GMP phosphodiesterase class II)